MQGVGHREAEWEDRYGALAGPFLYLLKSESSRSYKTYHSYATSHYLNMIGHRLQSSLSCSENALFDSQCPVQDICFIVFIFLIVMCFLSHIDFSFPHLISLIGKKVFNVPKESLGDVENVLAICDAGQLDNKVLSS